MKLDDLLEEFNIVINTPEGLTELRSLILGLAVRGKLVPQDPNDEPASELLKKIEAEKNRLYDEGEIRKPKELPLVKIDEIPFEIPEGWEWCRLGQVSTYGNNNSINPDEIDDDTWVLDLADIEKDTSRIVDFDTLKNRSSKSNKYLFNKGDVLYGKLRPYLNKVVIAVDDGICTTEIIPLKVLSGMSNKYLLYSLKRKDFLDYVNAITYGTKMPRLGTDDGRKALMPLPPLPEQHRIVQKIESLFAEVDELEAKLNRQTKLDKKLQVAVNAEVQQAPDAEASKSAWSFITSNFDTLYHTPEAIDNLKKNILNEAVRGRLVPQNPKDEPASELLKKIEAEKERLYDEGEIRKSKDLPPVKGDEVPFEIPGSWEWVKFNEISDFINGDRGKNYPNKDEYVNEGVAWINTGHIEPDGTLTTVDMNFITEEKYDSLRSGKIKKTDLVYCLRGATFGKTSFVTPYEKGAIASSLMIIRPFIEQMNQYIFKYLVSPVGRRQLYRFDNGSAQPNLSATSVRKYQFPLPPLEEQHRIVRRIEELFAICDRFKAQLEKREKVNERLVKGLVGEVLEGAGSLEKESIQEKEISVTEEPEEDFLTEKQLAFWQILCIAYTLKVLQRRKMLQGEMALAKYLYLVDRIGGVDTKFKFKQNNFGPYPSNFRRRLFTRSKYFYKAGKEGYEVIDLTKKSDRLFEKESEKSKQVQRSMENLTKIFEPYQKNRSHKLELLASVCWLVEKTGETDFEVIWDELENWETPKRDGVDCKADLFTKDEVRKTLQFIEKNDWSQKLKSHE